MIWYLKVCKKILNRSGISLYSDDEVMGVMKGFQEFLRKREYYISDDGIYRTFEELFEMYKKSKP